MADYSLKLQANIDTSQILRQLQTIEQKGLNVNIKPDSFRDLAIKIEAANKSLRSMDITLDKIKASNLEISNKIKTTGEEATEQVKKVNSELNKTPKLFRKTSQGLTDIFEKMSKFYAVSQAIGVITTSFDEAWNAVVDLDTAVTEFQKVSDLSGDSLDKYKTKLADIGKETARTGKEMLEAATIFKRSGFSEDDAATLAQMATLYQNIADGEVSAADASSFIIASMKAFNIEASNSIEILDSINSISNNFAVSSSDLATALPKVSATLAQAGNTMQQSMALITAGAEIMPNQASRIARGLRSVTLNLQGFNEEGEQDLTLVPKMESNFNKLGLTLYGQNGQLKSTFDIFKDLSGVWKDLDTNTKNYYASLIGGKTQVDIVNSILSNFTTAIKANEAALNNLSPAWQENEAYMQHIEAAFQGLKASFQSLVDSLVSSDDVVNAIHILTDVIDLLNTDLGKTIIKFVGFSTASSIAAKGMLSFGKEVSNLIYIIRNFNTVSDDLVLLSKLPKVLRGLKFGAVGATITLVGAAITGVIDDIKALDETIESSVGVQTKSVKKIKEETDSANQTFNDTNEAISTNKEIADKYIDTIEELTNKTNLNEIEQQQLSNAIDGLNKLFPELGLAIDDNTGKLNTEISTVRDLVAAYSQLAIAKAYATLAEETAKTKAEATLRKQSLEKQLETAKNVDEQKRNEYFKSSGIDMDAITSGDYSSISESTYGDIGLFVSNYEITKKQKELKKINETLAQADSDLEEIVKAQAKAQADYNALLKKSGVDTTKQSKQTKLKGGTGTSISTGGGTSTVKTAQEKVEESLKAQHEAYQKVISDMEYQLYIAEKNGASDEERIQMMQKIQEMLLSQRAVYEKQGLASNHEYIQELNKQWWSYADDIKDIQDKITENVKKAQEEQLENLKNSLDAQLELLKYLKDERVSAIDEQIAQLEKEKDTLKERNDEIKSGIELQRLEDALQAAKQKKVRIWKSGIGWTYEQDVEAVRQAQEELDEYKRNQQQEAEEKRIDEEIAKLEDYKQQWEDVVNNYEKQQNILLNEQTTGKNKEYQNIQDRIKNLEDFKNEYTRIINEINNLQIRQNYMGAGAGAGLSSGGGGGGGASSSSADNRSNQKKYLDNLVSSGTAGQKKWAQSQIAQGKYATGSLSVPQSGLSLVGEQGRELRVLNQGDGIIPNKLTENLMNLGRYNIPQLASIMNTVNQKDSSNNMNIQNLTVALPNIRDNSSVETIQRALLDLPNKLKQKAYSI